MSRETKIIALTGKGGVGKTSISAALVKLLVEEFPEKKILAIDASPRNGLSPPSCKAPIEYQGCEPI